MKKIIILYFIRLSVSNENSNVMNPLPLNNPITIEQKLTNIPPISKFQQFLNDNASVSKTAKVCEFIFVSIFLFVIFGSLIKHKIFSLVIPGLFGICLPLKLDYLNEDQMWDWKGYDLSKKKDLILILIFCFVIPLLITLLILIPFIININNKRIQWNWVNIIKYTLFLLLLIFYWCFRLSIINGKHKTDDDDDFSSWAKITGWGYVICTILLSPMVIGGYFFGKSNLDNMDDKNNTNLDNENINNENVEKDIEKKYNY